MSLARGEDPIHEGPRGMPADVGLPTVVIVIAPSAEERLRLARLVNDDVPVLLASSRDEAVALLGGDEAQVPELSVLTLSQPAAARGPGRG